MSTSLLVLRVVALLVPVAAGLLLRLAAWRWRAAPDQFTAPPTSGQERLGSTLPRATFFAGGLAFCLALCLPLLAPGLGTVDLGLPAELGLAVPGLLLVALGTTVAVWARWELGASWATAPRANAARDLTTSGPYAWVRHPVYLGVFLGLVGDAVAFANWAALLTCLLWVLPSLLWRARVEERLLADVHGEQHRRYRQGTRLLLPGLW
jgi:protein-S-isoprenylcysteine O-methyltransferase Ste14